MQIIKEYAFGIVMLVAKQSKKTKIAIAIGVLILISFIIGG